MFTHFAVLPRQAGEWSPPPPLVTASRDLPGLSLDSRQLGLQTHLDFPSASVLWLYRRRGRQTKFSFCSVPSIRPVIPAGLRSNQTRQRRFEFKMKEIEREGWEAAATFEKRAARCSGGQPCSKLNCLCLHPGKYFRSTAQIKPDLPQPSFQ